MLVSLPVPLALQVGRYVTVQLTNALAGAATARLCGLDVYAAMPGD